MPKYLDFRLEILTKDGAKIIADSEGRQHIEALPSYEADGLITYHDSDFLSDPIFQKNYHLAIQQNHYQANNGSFDIQWRAYIYLAFSKMALQLPGDFIEFGVANGFMARFVSEMMPRSFDDKSYYLVDTYHGIPESQASKTEKNLAISKNKRFYQGINLDEIRRSFEGHSHIKIIQGEVPLILEKLPLMECCFCSIDMNITVPEVEAFRWIWPKMVSGGIVLLDDYNSKLHREQKDAFNALAAELGFVVIALPTGQGFIIKH